MARKSRVNIQPPEKHIYKVGAYLRLSRDKNDGKNEDSLENQKNIILSYISDKDDFKLQSTYCDNDKTGTNFNREGFENLMNDIKSKKINCIIVKDLSRFGRDYKDCCNYIENIFPFLGVRFIAINDNFDTNNLTSNDILNMQLKNIVNEMYANDLSKKIKSSLRVKKEEGKYLGAFPPYGYLKDPNDKYKLIVDEEVRPVIEMIYQLKIQGKSYREIIIELEKLNIDCPNRYFYKKDSYKNKLWTVQTITSILRNEVYIGNLIQGKTTRKIKDNKKIVKISKDNWCITENNHEPIISLETFKKVEKINKYNFEKYLSYNKYDNNDNYLKGILVCGDCGKKLHIVRTLNENTRKLDYLRYVCRSKNTTKSKCNFKSINKNYLEDIILQNIKFQMKICKNISKVLKTDEYNNKLNSESDLIEKEIIKINLKLDKINNYYTNLYEDYLNGILNKEDYIEIKNNYKKDEKQLSRELILLKNDLEKIKKHKNNEFVKNMLKFEDSDNLNKDIIPKLIQKVTIYSKNRIEITFKFEEDFNIIKNDLNGGYFYE